MMTPALKQLTNTALELSIHERAQLVHVLIASIDEPADESMFSAWDTELEKRVRDIQEGKVKGIPAEEVFAKLEAKYR